MAFGDLTGKRVVVTGASKGIGARACRVLAEAGGSVMGIARSEPELQALKDELVGEGHSFDFACVDLMAPDMTQQLDGLFERFPPDVFINNAGATRPAAVQDVSVEDFDAVMNLNVRAGFFATQSAVRAMMREKPGDKCKSIIHLSSMMGLVSLPGRAVYSATKHALEGLTKAMALDLAPHRIRVNAIGPTYIETPLTRPLLENQAFRSLVQERLPLSTAEHPVGRVGDLDGALVFLSDSSLSDLITGTNVLVDGGWTAQ